MGLSVMNRVMLCWLPSKDGNWILPIFLNVGACLFLFLRMSVGLAIIFFCTLPENGLCYLMPDKFTGMRKQKLCSSVWKQRSVSIFFIGSIIVSPANISILIIVTSIFH